MLKKKYCVVMSLVVCLIIGGSLLAGAEEYDFRKMQWYMTRDEVKNSEAEHNIIIDDEDMLVYYLPIAGRDSFLAYFFNEDDQVYSSTIIFEDEYEDTNRYIEDYDYFKELLTKKYGEPFLDEINTADGIDENITEKGIHLLLGNLNYYASWLTDTTYIQLILMSEEREITLAIDYYDIIYYTTEILDLELEEDTDLMDI